MIQFFFVKTGTIRNEYIRSSHVYAAQCTYVSIDWRYIRSMVFSIEIFLLLSSHFVSMSKTQSLEMWTKHKYEWFRLKVYLWILDSMMPQKITSIFPKNSTSYECICIKTPETSMERLTKFP